MHSFCLYFVQVGVDFYSIRSVLTVFYKLSELVGITPSNFFTQFFELNIKIVHKWVISASHTTDRRVHVQPEMLQLAKGKHNLVFWSF